MWERYERRRVERTRSLITAPWCCIRQLSPPGCRSACQRRSPLSSRSTGPSINGSGTYIERCRTDTRRGSRRKSSIAEQPFFLSFFLSFVRSFYGRSRLPDLRLSRLLRAFIGQQARRLPARPAPDISAAGRGIIRIYSIHHHWSARRIPRHALRTRCSARARSGMREGEKERAWDIAESWTVTQLRMLRTGYVALVTAVAARPLRCWTVAADDVTAPMMPHWTTAGGPSENMPQVAFNAQVRRSSTVVATAQRELRTKSFESLLRNIDWKFLEISLGCLERFIFREIKIFPIGIIDS